MKIRSILHDHQMAEMPVEVVQLKNRIIIVQIVGTAIFDAISFSIKGAQFALERNMKLLAVLCLSLYFLKQVLQSSINAYMDAKKNSYSSLSDTYLTETVSRISNVVRGKVFQKQDGFSRIMQNSEIIMLLKEYIGYIWCFWQDLPTTIANIITAIIMSVTIMITEFMQTKNATHTIVFCIVLVLFTLIFAIIFKIRLKVLDFFRKSFRETRKENEVLMNDIRNIEPLIKREFSYRVSLLVKNLVKKRNLERKQISKLNFLQICRSCILALFMIAIIFLKLSYVGGISNITIEVMTDILAVSAVYSNILDKIVSILREIESITNTLKEAETSKEDVDKIMDVYYLEDKKEFTHENVGKITVNPFSFSYSGTNSIYELKNKTPFDLEKGDAYGVYAPTGAGKSTFMHLLTGKIQMDESPISYGLDCQKAYLASIMNEANGILGSQNVLSELTFGEQPVISKLLRILKGTHIYYDILRNLGLKFDDDNKVLEYLSTTTIQQYSTGQKQRLGIVKLLYNMTEDHQIVVFDEATNALDDETAKEVLKFISSFCQEDVPRIVFFVTHQRRITEEVTDGTITIVQNHFPTWEIVKS